MKPWVTFDANSNIIRVKLLDSSSTVGAGLTGLTSASSGLIIGTIANNEATTTVYTVASSNVETITTLGTYAAPTASKCRFKEVDSTNHKGIYELQFADARFSVASAQSLLISILGATNLAQYDCEIFLPRFDTQTATQSVAVASLAANSITTASIADGAFTGAKFASDGTLQSATGTTAVLASGEPSTDDILNHRILNLTGGLGAGQWAFIDDYTGSSRTAAIWCPQGTSGAWKTTPDNTTTYSTMPFYAFFERATAELAALPGTTPTGMQMLEYCYQALRNKVTQTATTQTMFKNDGSTSLGTSTVSDNGTTFTKGRIA